MNKIKPLEFQQKVVDIGVYKLLNNKKFIFQAPTGTGKTLIAATLINKYIELIPANEEYTFLHFSPSTGELNKQNALKFEEYRKTASLNRYNTWKLTSTKQMNISFFSKNTINFFGWDSLIKKTNTVTREIERGSWYDVLTTTLNKGTKIAIVIDEQHINKNSKATEAFLEEIKKLHYGYFNEDPVRIEMSATVKKEDQDKLDYRVFYSEAKNEELVKKSIKLNEDLDQSSDTEEKMMIYSAINKREDVIEVYNKHNLYKKGNLPLLVIQLPDANQSKGDLSLEIEKICRDILSHEKMHKNHIAIWVSGRHETLAGDKITKEDVESNDDIAVLVFKQAVATGWDIPRANIWVKLRNNMDKAFETQTLGRVLRNQFRKYYNNDLIDCAYIYTNDENVQFEIKDTFGEDAGSSETKRINKKPEIIKIKKDKLAIVEHDFEEIDIDKALPKILGEVKNKESYKNAFNDILNEETLEEWSTESFLKADIHNEFEANDMRSYLQYTLGLNKTLTLYKRWFLYKQSINNDIVTTILDHLINDFASKYPEIPIINRAYKYFYENVKSSQQLIFDIKTQINKWIHNSLKFRTIEFTPHEEVDIFKDYIDFEKVSEGNFDNHQFYKTSLKFGKNEKTIFDSQTEKDFYHDIISPIKGISKGESAGLKYFIYNQSDAKQYYYISYIDNTFKSRKYFPDFIIVKDKCIYIIDTKTYDGKLRVSGGEISEIKMDAMIELIKKGTIGQYTDKKIKFGYAYKQGSRWYVKERNYKLNDPFISVSINEFLEEN